MVAPRRFGPLVAAVLVALAALVLRLHQVQVREHALWAREAANLVRSAHTVPYHRGRILDRRGAVLVHDEEVYDVELVYRDFRREHLLGQVAHARSALEGRTVSLERTLANLEPWALELAHLRPAELQAFERGEALELGGPSVPATGDPAAEQRRGRAEDLRFYVRQILGATRREWNQVLRAAKDDGARRSYLDLLARVRRRPAQALEEGLGAAARRTQGDLERLALLLELRDAGEEPAREPAAALALLLFQLDQTRAAVEDSVASQLFRAAAGFDPGRLPCDLVGAAIDLGWIARTVRWTPERVESWLARARAGWSANLERLFVPGARIRAELGTDLEHPAHRLLSELAGLFEAGSEGLRRTGETRADWRRVERIAVWAEVGALFEGPRPKLDLPRLPFQDPELRARARRGEDPWAVLADLLAATSFDAPAVEDGELGWPAPRDGREAAARLRLVLEPGPELSGAARRLASEDRRELPLFVARAWQRELEARAAELLASAGAGTGSAPRRLSRARLERALEQRRYVLIDRGSRPQVVAADPRYDVVHLLTRSPERFQGFQVRERMHRRPLVGDAAGRPPAAALLGTVRPSTLSEFLEQQELRRRLSDLRRKTVRAEEDLSQLEELVAQIYRNDELRGTGGIEGLLDDVLRGQNGFRENEGLEERESRRREPLYVPPIDGRDVVLSLDAALQLAAEAVLDAPELPDSERLRDEPWFANPVGAIAIVTVEGEVLAAASTPRERRLPKPGRDGQEALVIDRTLRRPTFQPVGSVFKAFVAVHALDRHGLDPFAELPCRPIDGRGAGWIDLRCWHSAGHGRLALHGALRGSCNAYFAQLGEHFAGRAEFTELCHAFGFDRPTGVRAVGRARAFPEDFAMLSFVRPRDFEPREQRQAANGLAVIEGTPLQVARAFAALATGRLPELRLVRAVDGQLVRESSRPLPYSEAHLERVRKALRAVVAEAGGSAFGRGLDERTLGFTFAAKTGSADYRPLEPEGHVGLVVREGGQELPDLRKHTWLAGWFPAEDPRLVLVVYLHDVAFTSSHTAVHVASQMLRRPELRAALDAELARGGAR